MSICSTTILPFRQWYKTWTLIFSKVREICWRLSSSASKSYWCIRSQIPQSVLAIFLLVEMMFRWSDTLPTELVFCNFLCVDFQPQNVFGVSLSNDWGYYYSNAVTWASSMMSNDDATFFYYNDDRNYVVTFSLGSQKKYDITYIFFQSVIINNF